MAASFTKNSTGNVIPTTADEVTADWFTSVTGIEIPESKTFKILKNPNASVGNLSQMVRVGFSSEDQGQGHDRSFFIKLRLVPTNDFERGVLEVIIVENMDGREVFFYQTLKSELERLVPELSQFFVPCRCAVKNDTGSVVILEDMGPQGYWMPGFASGLAPTFYHRSIHFIAQFHFAGELLQLEHGRGANGLLTSFPLLNTWHVPRSDSTVSLVKQFPSLDWFSVGLEFMAANLLKPSDAELFRALIPHSEKIIRWITEAGSKNPTIIHDDLWPYNFLCHDNGGIKVIDWQLVGFTDPAYELVYFFMSSLPEDKIDSAEIRRGLETYYKIKQELYNRKQLKMGRSLEEFLEFFETYGLCYGFLIITMSADSIYAQESYRPKLSKIYSYFCDAQIPQRLLAQHANN